jgi:NTP pyrophosphatase (non-canonical NTP hydrolase)
MYYLYHIPGKKIGVTSNLNTRVTLIQGYKEGEYEVLDSSDDIDYISDLEIELQKSYGYKVDMKKYNELFKKSNQMKINATEQTSTFPYPINKLKENLLDNKNLIWKTDHGLFKLNDKNINWIIGNAKVSMFNDNRSYIYNKALASYIKDDLDKSIQNPWDLPINQNNNYTFTLFDNIRQWAKDRGLYDKGDAKTQYIKLQEECGELAKALLSDDEPEVVDAIGDIVVVLTNLAAIRGYHIEACIDSAYRVISKRTGKMVNGTFVKDEN